MCWQALYFSATSIFKVNVTFICNRHGDRWQIQLKGSGQTPYSRVHDGRAVLRAAVREMIACEACHFLGIPSVRAGGLVGT